MFVIRSLAFAFIIAVSAQGAAEDVNGAKTYPVFVHYKRPYTVPSLRAPFVRSKVLVELQSQVRRLRKDVFKSLQLPVSAIDFDLWIAGGTVANLTRQQIRKVQQHYNVQSISMLGREGRLTDFGSELAMTKLRSSYTYGLSQIKVPDLRIKYFGLDGTSIRVGVIDTGIDANHADLKGRVLVYRDWINSRITVPRDDHGHGTHVAGTVGADSSSRLLVGVAPKVSFVVAKAFDRDGDSKDSDLLAALQWMADPDQDPATDDSVQVINNSWNVDGSIGSLDSATEPFCLAIDGLRNLGIVSVFAAGNDGGGRGKIKIPGACPNALTVSATDRGDQVSSFSSRGPANWKSGTVAKPDVAAPGKDVDSTDSGGGYRTRSGTSMAAPHVTGAVAILFQVNNGLTVDEIKTVLMSTSEDIETKGPDVAAGAGRIDLFRAVDSQ